MSAARPQIVNARRIEPQSGLQVLGRPSPTGRRVWSAITTYADELETGSPKGVSFEFGRCGVFPPARGRAIAAPCARPLRKHHTPRCGFPAGRC